MKHLLTLSALLLTLPAYAALAPDIQESRELASVAEAVGKRFPDQPIKNINRRDYDIYDVVVGKCRLKAKIVTLPTPPGMVGPRRYTVRLTRPKCGAAKQ